MWFFKQNWKHSPIWDFKEREPLCFTETKLMKQLIYAIKRKWIILGS